MVQRLREDAQRDLDRKEGIEPRLGPPPVPDFGFYHPLDYVERAIAFLRISNWNCWPESGGWAEQDSRIVEDVLTYSQLEQRIRWEVEHKDLMESSGVDDLPRLKL